MNSMAMTYKQHQTVYDLMPKLIPGLLAIVQLFLWLSIIILEIVSIFHDAGRGTIYAGLWCSIVFFMTWISMFSFLCCGRARGCGIYLMVQNIINVLFAIVLLVFTYIFYHNPCVCYGVLCSIPNWDYIYGDLNSNTEQYSCTTRTLKKYPILQGLIICAIIMVVSNCTFILVYTIISIRIYIQRRSAIRHTEDTYRQQTDFLQIRQQPLFQSSILNYSPAKHQELYPFNYTQMSTNLPSAPIYHNLAFETV